MADLGLCYEIPNPRDANPTYPHRTKGICDAVCGTPDFMPPEECAKTPIHSFDAYSLGVVIRHMEDDVRGSGRKFKDCDGFRKIHEAVYNSQGKSLLAARPDQRPDDEAFRKMAGINGYENQGYQGPACVGELKESEGPPAMPKSELASCKLAGHDCRRCVASKTTGRFFKGGHKCQFQLYESPKGDGKKGECHSVGGQAAKDAATGTKWITEPDHCN